MPNINFSISEEDKKEVEAAYEVAAKKIHREQNIRLSFSAWIVSVMKGALRKS